MRILSKDFICLLLLIGNAAEGYDITSCRSPIHIDCSPNQITILDVNITSSLAKDLLKQCNSHQQCDVLVSDKECIQLSYWCKMKVHIVEIPDSSDLQQDGDLSIFSLISHGYQQGNYIETGNVKCRLRPKEDRTDMIRMMKVTVNDLTPNANPVDFCLTVNAAHECSSSKKLHVTFGPFQSNTGWDIEIQLSLVELATAMPQIRFWLDIFVTPHDDHPIYHLECRSNSRTYISLTTSPPVDGAKKTTRTVAITVVILGILVFIGTFISGAALKCRKRKNNHSSRTAEAPNEYAEIDDRAIEDEPPRLNFGLQDMLRRNEEIQQPRFQNRELPQRPTLRGQAEAGASREHVAGVCDKDEENVPEDFYENSEQDGGCLRPRKGHRRTQKNEVENNGHDENEDEDEELGYDDAYSRGTSNYMGLSAEMRQEENKRSSVGLLYTLLSLKERFAARRNVQMND